MLPSTDRQRNVTLIIVDEVIRQNFQGIDLQEQKPP